MGYQATPKGATSAASFTTRRRWLPPTEPRPLSRKVEFHLSAAAGIEYYRLIMAGAGLFLDAGYNLEYRSPTSPVIPCQTEDSETMLPVSHPVLLVHILLMSVYYSGAAAAALSWEQTSEDGQVTVTEQDEGQTVAVARKGTLVVRLKSQLGTGYGWQVVRNDKRRLKLLASPEQENSQGGLPGGGEHQIFRFKALRSGKTLLELGYVRPWEKGKAPLKAFRLEVRVR